MCVLQGSSPLLPSKVSVKRERDVAAADSNAGRAAKRRAGAPGPAGAAAAGGLLANQGLDLDALAALLNTPLARQLGAEGACVDGCGLVCGLSARNGAISACERVSGMV